MMLCFESLSQVTRVLLCSAWYRFSPKKGKQFKNQKNIHKVFWDLLMHDTAVTHMLNSSMVPEDFESKRL